MVLMMVQAQPIMQQDDAHDAHDASRGERADGVRHTFYITYVMLLTTGTITLIEALRNKTPSIRHIMNIETCISLVAAFFYGELLKQASQPQIDFAELTKTRYLDWCITTPLMLLGVSLVFAHNNNAAGSKAAVAVAKTVTLSYLLLVFALNAAMLALGYMGESGALRKPVAHGTSFLAFFALFGVMYHVMVRGSSTANLVVFAMMVCIWFAYGVVYAFDQRTKNVCLNVLDLLAKCIMGILFWAYFTKTITL